MPRERQNRDPRGFESHRGMMSSIFGGRDPFDDPFFNRPFGSMLEPSIFDTHDSFNQHASSSNGLVIRELDSDEEEEGKNIESEASGKGPLIEHPDDEEKVKTDVKFSGNPNRTEQPKPETRSVSHSFKKVTYGGINGAYYSATTSRKSGSDGVVIEDSKEADKTTGQATHRVSKGIHDKGHSVTRKLGTDGKVDTLQTLHNLNEDEVAGFEQEWKGNADVHIPGWNEEFNFFERAGYGSMRPFGLALEGGGRGSNDDGGRWGSSGGRPKKVVTINID